MQSVLFEVAYLKDTAGYLFSKGLVSKWNLLQKNLSLHEEDKKRVNNILKIGAALVIYFWETMAYSREKYKYILGGEEKVVSQGDKGDTLGVYKDTQNK